MSGWHLGVIRCLERGLWDTGRPPRVSSLAPAQGALRASTCYIPHTRGNKMEDLINNKTDSNKNPSEGDNTLAGQDHDATATGKIIEQYVQEEIENTIVDKIDSGEIDACASQSSVEKIEDRQDLGEEIGKADSDEDKNPAAQNNDQNISKVEGDETAGCDNSPIQSHVEKIDDNKSKEQDLTEGIERTDSDNNESLTILNKAQHSEEIEADEIDTSTPCVNQSSAEIIEEHVLPKECHKVVANDRETITTDSKRSENVTSTEEAIKSKPEIHGVSKRNGTEEDNPESSGMQVENLTLSKTATRRLNENKKVLDEPVLIREKIWARFLYDDCNETKTAAESDTLFKNDHCERALYFKVRRDVRRQRRQAELKRLNKATERMLKRETQRRLRNSLISETYDSSERKGGEVEGQESETKKLWLYESNEGVSSAVATAIELAKRLNQSAAYQNSSGKAEEKSLDRKSSEDKSLANQCNDQNIDTVKTDDIMKSTFDNTNGEQANIVTRQEDDEEEEVLVSEHVRQLVEAEMPYYTDKAMELLKYDDIMAWYKALDSNDETKTAKGNSLTKLQIRQMKKAFRRRRAQLERNMSKAEKRRVTKYLRLGIPLEIAISKAYDPSQFSVLDPTIQDIRHKTTGLSNESPNERASRSSNGLNIATSYSRESAKHQNSSSTKEEDKKVSGEPPADPDKVWEKCLRDPPGKSETSEGYTHDGCDPPGSLTLNFNVKAQRRLRKYLELGFPVKIAIGKALKPNRYPGLRLDSFLAKGQKRIKNAPTVEEIMENPQKYLNLDETISLPNEIQSPVKKPQTLSEKVSSNCLFHSEEPNHFELSYEREARTTDVLDTNTRIAIDNSSSCPEKQPASEPVRDRKDQDGRSYLDSLHYVDSTHELERNRMYYEDNPYALSEKNAHDSKKTSSNYNRPFRPIDRDRIQCVLQNAPGDARATSSEQIRPSYLSSFQCLQQVDTTLVLESERMYHKEASDFVSDERTTNQIASAPNYDQRYSRMPQWNPHDEITKSSFNIRSSNPERLSRVSDPEEPALKKHCSEFTWKQRYKTFEQIHPNHSNQDQILHKVEFSESSTRRPHPVDSLEPYAAEYYNNPYARNNETRTSLTYAASGSSQNRTSTYKTYSSKESLQQSTAPTQNVRSAYPHKEPLQKETGKHSVESQVLKVGLLHFDHPHTQLSSEQLAVLEGAIMDAFDDIPENGPQVRFLACSQKRGYLHLECADSVTLNWLESTLYRLSLRGGSRIKIVEGYEPPHLQTCTVLIPNDRGTRVSEGKVLDRLRKMNHGLLTQNWKIHGCKDQGSRGFLWTFEIDERSMEVLKEVNFSPYYRFGRVDFRVCKKASGGSSETRRDPDPEVSTYRPRQTVDMSRGRSSFAKDKMDRGWRKF